MKEGWETVKLGDVCRTGAGGTPLKSKNEYYLNGTIPWLMSGEVAQGNITGALHFITKSGLDNSSAKIFPVNTVLVAMYGATAGQVGILRFEASTNQAVCGILPNNRFIPEFLYYLFLQKKEELIAKATGNAQPNISQIKIKNTIIPLPPLPEQERIVAILDEAFVAIATATANTEKNLANAREVFESQLNEVFKQKGDGWDIKTLDDLCEIARGGSPRPIKSYLTSDPDGINWIKISDATASTKYICKTKEKIKPEGIHRSRMVYGGDFLLSNSMSFGRPYIMKTSGCIHDGWLLLRDKSGSFDKNYLYYFLGSAAAYRQFDYLASGSTVRNLNIDLVRKVEVPIPPISDQEQIVMILNEFFAKTGVLNSIYVQKLSLLSELKQSILHKAFTGELTADPESGARTLKEAGL